MMTAHFLKPGQADASGGKSAAPLATRARCETGKAHWQAVTTIVGNLKKVKKRPAWGHGRLLAKSSRIAWYSSRVTPALAVQCRPSPSFLSKVMKRRLSIDYALPTHDVPTQRNESRPIAATGRSP